MKKTVLGIIALFILSTVAYAVPDITINSPTNTTYSDYGAIPINVTSTEPVNFYFVMTKAQRKTLVKNSSTLFNTDFYGSRGTINLTIFANNSNGSAKKSVIFTINHSSVINVTSCGGIGSPNTTYVLQNDIDSGGGLCMIVGARDSTFDLNGFTMYGGPVIAGNCDSLRIMNGHMVGGDGIQLDSGTKCNFINISLEADGVGVRAEFFYSSLFENFAMSKVTTGFVFTEPVTNIFMKNFTMSSDKETAVAFEINTYDSVFTLENSNVTNFTQNMIFNQVNNIDWYFKNTGMNLFDISPDSTIYGRLRMFKEHLLKINTTNDLGQPISASVELEDNGLFQRTNREENAYTFDSNPTGRIFVGTDENGYAETFITERLIEVKTESPPSFEEHVFSPYNITARAGTGENALLGVSVVLNSTLQSNFTINPGGSGSMSQCTIDQMLDLDNNGVLNSKDAQIILRRMVGHSVSVNGTKECNALNFLPV